jgi:hypothetical protein
MIKKIMTVAQELPTNLQPIFAQPEFLAKYEKRMLEGFEQAITRTGGIDKNLLLFRIFAAVILALSLHAFVKKLIKHSAKSNPTHEILMTMAYWLFVAFFVWWLSLDGKPMA